jgi:hypothetical protein
MKRYALEQHCIGQEIWRLSRYEVCSIKNEICLSDLPLFCGDPSIMWGTSKHSMTTVSLDLSLLLSFHTLWSKKVEWSTQKSWKLVRIQPSPHLVNFQVIWSSIFGLLPCCLMQRRCSFWLDYIYTSFNSYWNLLKIQLGNFSVSP